MKLSAPPPPPPEPNDPGSPTPDQQPAPGGEAPPAPETPAAPGDRPATWPAWFGGADFTLAVFTVVLAFLAASFVARNSDLFLHVAAGQRLLAGTYAPGSDPFSYTAADRPWVNHSILFDVGCALLYSGNGGLLVAVKAAFAAAAFGLVIAIRKPAFPLWPWAAVAAVGVVAAAPYLHLRPTVGSLFLLAVTLLLLFRLPHRAGSWRFPAAIGVTFWVWANVDEWFFIGPAALALVLVGELVQRRGLAAPGTPGPDAPPEEPLAVRPDVPTLAKALAVGVLACMLNPHHVRVWQLPFELTGARELAADLRFKQLLLTPFDSFYTNNAPLGYNHNGLCFALLFVGGGTALGLAGGRVRVAHVALWVGFAVLALATVFAIPFLALVAVPVVAGQLNAVSARATLTTWGNPRTRFLLLGSGGGRVVSLLGVLVACVLAVPGWVHPPANNAAFARRVAWAVEPEASMVKGAEQLQAWRAAGQLPPEAHGFGTSLEFANYCALFAPDEKVYANGRFNHHRPEFGDFLTVRVGLGLVATDEKPSPRALTDALARHDAEYVVVHSGPGDSAGMRRAAANTADVMWRTPDDWSAWYLDGRTTISGWRTAPGAGRPAFAALRVDPVALAFGPGVERLPQGSVQPVPPPAGWEDAFVRSPGFPPGAADEATAWLRYKYAVQSHARPRLEAVDLAAALARRVGVPAPRIAAPDGLPLSAPVLALRAARRAVAADPNHPDGYYALAQALGDPDLPLTDADRTLGRLTALRQCLERMPPPEEFKLGVYTASPTEVAVNLAFLYLGRRQEYGVLNLGVPVGNLPAFQVLTEMGATGAVVEPARGRFARVPALSQQGTAPPPYYLLPLDVARETFQRAERYAQVEIAEAKTREDLLTAIRGELKAFESELARSSNAFETRRAGKKLPEQVVMALQFNLTGEALKLLGGLNDPELAKEFGEAKFQFRLIRAALELALGRLEDAAADLEQVGGDPADEKARNAPGIAEWFRWLVYHRFVYEGAYTEAGQVLAALDGPGTRPDQAKPVRDRFDPKFFVATGRKVEMWGETAPFAALLAPTQYDLLARVVGPSAALNGFAGAPGYVPLRNDLAGRVARDADFFYQRGVLFLFEGDVAAARRQFLLTRVPGTPEWGLTDYRHARAEAYLKLIDQAEKAAPRK
ncbi:Uncharacterized protein OS=Planctomyces maris DSM 8797 GN=PM8797T_19430 PE=4 SV=1 [Gemmataceae bacterium]|nr:Uncharacterized protein OS=Planctomyces maris DSM 8797 GN=PM8797T_19430 PE=4 SV=1 [Gemmataceae bacterium]VTT97384.1 Uncharacterized protein OS=Planctomyces maris DSM 8797 GN=PM8797T_19430 PE=4 SV=1 [Gemmataceae bacterium]